MKPTLIIGNWKTYLSHDDSLTLAQSVISHYVKHDQCEAVICPSYTVIGSISHLLNTTDIKLGSQDISPFEHGAHTGDITAYDIKQLGCQYTLIGHSERRSHYHEHSHSLIKKSVQAIANNLIPVICIGESLDCYRNNQTQAFLQSQLDPLFLNPLVKPKDLVIAYEPIWAIGSGYTPKPDEIDSNLTFISSYTRHLCPDLVSLKVLYGGSVTPKNCQSIVQQPSVDGFLVGRASTNESDFLSIITQSNQEFIT